MNSVNYLVGEGVWNEPPLPDHVRGDPAVLVCPVDAGLDHVLEAVVHLGQDVADRAQVEPAKSS